ncbi:Argininosuccinate lyase 2 [Rhodovastum atsumiense]|uniref:Argininosuccinate lyase n=1 Tax=Rhodovastum atsumiense TaxID=504468 RepID=A0A5M6J1Z7_9PROT|nr:argininosuccinate lyase [Rhodovastum atsumiense]KAA5614107.1 argininosuccinate lyase [Rhodovastum atsumiense]CAH2598949.1 Argininosuccinate lyase 2 [Rhodovastum atsumiense]
MTIDDTSRFPAPAYRDAVLAPLFDETRRHYAGLLERVNRAHAVMLAEQGLLTEAEAGKLLDALAALRRDIDLDQVTYTGAFEDLFFLIEHLLGERVGRDLAGRLHTGRSRNDMDVTIFKMALKARLRGLIGEVADLAAALLDIAARERATLVVAYTHGQPAQPTTFGHYLAAFAEILLRDLGRLLHAHGDVDLCSMGAAAITTTGFPLSRPRMAELLGFTTFQDNSYGCIAAADYLAGAYAAMKVLFLNVGRFVQDLNSWTSFEVGQLYVPNAFVQVSSIMPQKRNPVPVEHMRLLASHAVGQCDVVMGTLHNTPFTDMNDAEGPTQSAGYQAFATAGRLLPLLTAFVQAVRVREDRARAIIDAACLCMTELADSLARAEGLSFRQAHEVASRLSRQLIETGTGLSGLDAASFAALFTEVVGRPPRLEAEALHRFASPEHFVAVRTLPGGPGEAALTVSLQGLNTRLGDVRDRLAALAQAEDAAMSRLDAAVARLVAIAAER